ncbi:MAG: hypothetical protein ABSF28_07530 [Terracidiphilus sp.]|jgi:hypothetical protein
MTMDDSIRLTYLTRHYYELQGIRTAPMWLCFLAMQTHPDSVRSYGKWNDLFPSVAMCLMILFSWLAGRYYRRRFGWLNPAWISLPKSRFYWSLVMCLAIWSFFSLIFLGFLGNLPYVLTLVWISPLFNKENLPLRRIYFAVAGAVVVFSALFLQITHRDGRIIVVIQCLVLLALGIADHLLLMSLLAPAREAADA